MSHLDLEDPLVLDALCQRMLRETEEYLARHLHQTEPSQDTWHEDDSIPSINRSPSCEMSERDESPQVVLQGDLAYHQ